MDLRTGDAVDRKVYGEYDDKRVFFCHKGSKTRFEPNVVENFRKIKGKGMCWRKRRLGIKCTTVNSLTNAGIGMKYCSKHAIDRAQALPRFAHLTQSALLRQQPGTA